MSISRLRNLYFRNCRKTWIFSLFETTSVSIGEDDKKINDMVIEDNVSTMDSKTGIDQELKSEGQGQGQKISIFKNGRKQEFLVNLGQYW